MPSALHQTTEKPTLLLRCAIDCPLVGVRRLVYSSQPFVACVQALHRASNIGAAAYVSSAGINVNATSQPPLSCPCRAIRRQALTGAAVVPTWSWRQQGKHQCLSKRSRDVSGSSSRSAMPSPVPSGVNGLQFICPACSHHDVCLGINGPARRDGRINVHESKNR